MADTKISGLSAGAPAQAGDLIPIARSGANYSITPANILAYGSSPVAGTTAAFSSTLAAGATTITGAATVSTTLGVTGATTLSSTLAAGNTTITGTLSATSTLSTTGGAAKAEAAASQAKSVVGAFNAGTAAATAAELITFAQAGTQKISHFWANSTTAYQIQTLASGAKIQLMPDTGGTVVADVTSTGLAVTGTGTFSGGIVGTTTNNAAAAGCVGEYVSSTIAPGSAVTITTTVTSQDITTISLTAGDWLVSINGAAQSTGSVTTRIFFWIGTIAGNDASEATAGTMADFNYALPINATVPGAVPSFRISLASTTTVRYKAYANFSGTQPTIQGRISATRVR